MSFVRLLGMVNFVPEQVDSKSEVVIDKHGDGFSIPRSISLRRTKATLIYKRTGNLRAVQLLLGHVPILGKHFASRAVIGTVLSKDEQ